MPRTHKTPSAIKSRVTAAAQPPMRKEPPQEDNNVNIGTSVDNDANVNNAAGRKTIADPGPRQGLRPGWTRATVIVPDDILTTLKDYAYTHRTSLKSLVTDALTEYVGRLDLTGLIHKEQ